MMEKRVPREHEVREAGHLRGRAQEVPGAEDYFQKYSGQYKLDFLLMAAQGYQESQLDQDAKSHVGAVGVMQLMPATGKDMKVATSRRPRPTSMPA